MANVDEFHNKLRELAKISLEYRADYTPAPHFATELHGYSEATISLAVYKKVNPPEFAREQAWFMSYLGDQVCPKIYAVNSDSYCMEYLYPVEYQHDSLIVQENFLEKHVWNRGVWGIHEGNLYETIPIWAIAPICVIHGDPTLDNVLMTKDGFIRITDPIPPQWLKKPSIKAVDHGKILQSFLGWEVVLRGVDLIEYEWPLFMHDYCTARKAIFWAMIALQRIAKRDIFDSATQWATRVGKELEELCM
jgi:hypothetical protein